MFGQTETRPTSTVKTRPSMAAAVPGPSSAPGSSPISSLSPSPSPTAAGAAAVRKRSRSPSGVSLSSLAFSEDELDAEAQDELAVEYATAMDHLQTARCEWGGCGVEFWEIEPLVEHVHNGACYLSRTLSPVPTKLTTVRIHPPTRSPRIPARQPVPSRQQARRSRHLHLRLGRLPAQGQDPRQQVCPRRPLEESHRRETVHVSESRSVLRDLLRCGHALWQLLFGFALLACP